MRHGGGRRRLAAMTTESAFDPGIWIADPVHSSVGFAVRHMSLSTYRRRFDDFEATLRVDDVDQPVLTGRGRLELRGAREVSFQSRDVRRSGAHLELDGVLTIDGRSLLVAACGTFAAPWRDPSGATRLGLQMQTRVDRRQFGLDLDDPLFDHEVVLEADLQLVRG